jgi:iron-sulfur cluster assembly protein
MIEITDRAADVLRHSLVEDKVIRMFLAAIDATGANYGMALGSPEKNDVVFESKGVEVHMSPEEAKLLGETIIDYADDERGRGFIIRGPLDEIAGCGGCGHGDTCDHDHGACDHEGCGHDRDHDCGCC